MPASPRTPVPSSSRMSSVSAWSSAVCPSAIRAAPTRSAAVSSAAWRAARAAASTEPAATRTPTTSTGTPRRAPSARTNSASRAESGRRRWSTCRTCSRRSRAPARRSRTWSSATESAPPETPIKTVSPPASIAWRRMVRSAAWTRSTSAALQAHPDLAVLEVLLLPHRDGALEGVDRIAAGLEGVAAVRGRHRDEHRRLADLEPADAVEYRHAPHARPARADRAADLAHLRLGHGRVRLVLEELHRAPVGLVADDTGEDDDAAGAGIVHGLRDGVGGEGAIDDGEDVVGHFTARPNGLRLTLAFSIISPLASPEAPARLALPLTGGNRHRSTMALTSLVCSIISPLASPEAPARLALPPLTGGNRQRSSAGARG